MTKQRSSKPPKSVRRTQTTPEGFFAPFNIEEVPWKRLGGTSFKRLGRYGGGSQVGVGIDVLQPKRYSNRLHYHLHEEEHIFILRGSATLILGPHKFVMNKNDYCCFPAGQAAGHHLFNHTNEKCVFMTIGDNKTQDIACFPKTGKAKVRATGKTIPLCEVRCEKPAQRRKAEKSEGG